MGIEKREVGNFSPNRKGANKDKVDRNDVSDNRYDHMLILY